MSIPRIELQPGYTISRIVRGGWQLAEGHGRTAVPVDAALEGMRRAVEAGITTFDCADIYTGVEELIGRFLRSRKAERPVEIHTKFVPDLGELASLGERRIEATIDRSLRRLGVDRLDLVQFHWWDYEVPGYVEAAATLDRLRRDGKIRYVGATNFDVTHLSELVDAGIPIASNQVQYSVLDRRPAGEMSSWCAARGISLLCYGTLAGGFLTNAYLESESVVEPLENRSLTKYRLIIDEFGGWQAYQGLLRVLAAVAKRHQVSVAAVATRFVLECPQVAAAIVGLCNPAHLSGAQRIFNFELDPQDRAAIDACLSNAPGPKGPVYALERIKGGRHRAIMKTDLNRM